jgi:putative endonuclease
MSKDKGQFGEDMACEYLQKNDFQILARNYRFRQHEIDIVASKNNAIHFVEVKLRGSDNFGSPASFVSKAQQRSIAKAADAYLRSLDSDPDCQFDIVSIFKENNRFKLEYIDEAFRPMF